MTETKLVKDDKTGVVSAQRSDTRDERTQAVIEFVRENPGLAFAGSLAAGLLLGSLLPRRPVRRLARRGAKLAEAVGTTAVMLGHDAADRAETAGAGLRRGGGFLAEHAEELAALALRGASAFGHTAVDRIEQLSGAAAGSAEKFGEVAAKNLGKASDEAVDRFGKVWAPTEATATTAGRRLGHAASRLRARIIG